MALTDAEALDILGQVGRQAFMGFVRRARSQNNRLESAKELKKLVFFSNIVIAPLVEDLQVGRSPMQGICCPVKPTRCGHALISEL